MIIRSRKSRHIPGRQTAWRGVCMVALPVVALALVAMPKSFTDTVRGWTAPIFSPLQNAAQGMTLDLADKVHPHEASAAGDEGDLQTRLDAREGALAEAAATLAWYDRQLRNMTRIRGELDNMPCRLIPARLLASEVSGGRAGAKLSEGANKSIAKRGAVITRRIDRGVRELLEKGEPVLSAAGLIGMVDDVGPLTSTVRLITDPDPRSTMMIQIITRRDGQWRAGPEGIARGTSDGAAVAVLGIQRSADIAVGDFVVTSPSPEAGLPPYLIVGKIARAELKPASLEYDIVVEPRFKAGESPEVYVVSPEAPAAPLRK